MEIRQNIVHFTENRTRTFSVGLRRHNHHVTCYVINFTNIFITPPHSRTDLGHTPLSNRCTRHFSLPHHALIFSRIHPLGGQADTFDVYSGPESRVQRPKSSDQCPPSRAQRPEPSVQLLRPESTNSGIVAFHTRETGN